MLRRQLRALVYRTRGGHTCRTILARIEDGSMTEAEAQEWWLLRRHVQDDAREDGKAEVRRRGGW